MPVAKSLRVSIQPKTKKKPDVTMRNLCDEWERFIFTFPVDGGSLNTLHSFSFQLPIVAGGQLNKLDVHVAGLEGASLLIRFFYGLRNILSHGDAAPTFNCCLREFVGDAEIATGDKPSQDARSALVGHTQNALAKYGCSVAENEGDLTIAHVAEWMAHKICEFTRFGQHVRVSTVLLETMNGFLAAVVRAYTTGLVEQITKAQKLKCTNVSDDDDDDD
jgi:hypothetical protein